MNELSGTIVLSKEEYEAIYNGLKNELKKTKQLQHFISSHEKKAKMLKNQKEQVEGRLQSILDNLPDIVLIMDVNQKYISGTSNSLQALGINVGNIHEKDFTSIFLPIAPEKWVKKWKNNIQGVLKSGSPYKKNMQPVSFNDTLYYYDLNVIPFTNEVGNTIEVMLSIHKRFEMSEKNLPVENLEAKELRFTAPSAKVLIVDDIVTNLKVVEGLMAPYRMQVDLCKSGKESIERAKSNLYDIVFMDYMMPEMDGIEALTNIRKLEGDNGYYQSAPIIALTADDALTAQELLLRSGFNGFLAKPIETSKLNEILKKWIPGEKQEKYVERGRATVMTSLKIRGIDVKTGISMTGGIVENYMKMLAVFYKDGMEKINDITSCLQTNNLKDYTIHVHALRSAAGNIGAAQISAVARSLEYAGKKNDITFIQKKNDDFLDQLRSLLKDVQHAVKIDRTSKQEAAGSADVSFLKGEAAHLVSAIQNIDMQAVDSIINCLQQNRWNQSVSEAIENISHHILMCEYDKALTLLETMINE